MPKTDIDYSNTIIYKITCKDANVKDVYVGHTTNFVQRKHSHKQGCINKKSSNYKCKLYETIRTNGGWNNWNMEIINFFKCRDHYEARIKEQEYFVSLNATLNSIEPLPKPKSIPKPNPKEVIPENTIPIVVNNLYTEKTTRISKKYSCTTCRYTTRKNPEYMRHLKTVKHIKNINDSEIPKDKTQLLSSESFTGICSKKSEYKYSCAKCMYNTNNICNYNKHMLTPKHNDNSEKNEDKYSCSCCHYNTSDKYDYNKHLLTQKHITNYTLYTNKDTFHTLLEKGEYNYFCSCCKYHTNILCNYNKHLLTTKHIQQASKDPQPTQSISESQSTSGNQESDTQIPQPNWVEMMKMLMKENQEIRNFMVTQHNMIIEQNNKLDCIVNRVLTANNVTSGET